MLTALIPRILLTAGLALGGPPLLVQADPNTLHPQEGGFVLEDRGKVNLAVTRAGDLASPASLDYATSDRTARAGEDYAEARGTLDFAPGETQKHLSIPVLNDGVRESSETFRVQWSNPKGASLAGPGTTTTVRIVDNDPGVSFDDAAPLVQEDAGQVTLTVRRGNDVALDPFTVDFAAGNRTAREGSDYAAVRGALSFAAGEITKTITIPILNDGVRESSEVFSVTLSSVSGAGILGTPATSLVTIDDNDPGVHLRGAAVNESDAEATLVIYRGRDFDLGPFSVEYFTTDGGAKAGVDYVASSGTVRFAEGELFRTITIPILNDAVREGGKTFKVSLRNPADAVIAANPAVSVGIEDNDSGIHFAFPDAWAREGPSAAATVTVERGLDESTSAAEVEYFTRDGSALAGQDYVETKGVLRFEAGEQSKMISIALLNDGITEPQEDFTVTLADAWNGATLGSPRTVKVRIEDNDSGAFAASISPLEGAAQAMVEVYRGNDGDFPMTVDYATQDDSALAGKDYLPVSGTLAFGPGETSKRFAVPILNDAFLEPDEQFRVILSNVTGGAEVAPAGWGGIVTIMDDDPGPGFDNSSGDVTTWENGGSVSITVRRGTDDPRPFTVDYATQDGLARSGLDYVATRGTLRFDAGVKSMTLSIPILDDLAAGAPGDFKVILSNATNGLELSPSTTQTIRILDNEALPTLDRPFSKGLQPDGHILALAVQPDGRILVGGEFGYLGSAARSRIARLLPDGTVDPSFVPDAVFANEGNVTAIAAQPDGRILAAIGYRFTRRSEPGRCHLARLFPDGRIDPSFQSPPDWEPHDEVTSIALEPGGNIRVVLSYSGVQSLKSDGARDELLSRWSQNGAAAAQPDGRVLVVGDGNVTRYNSDNSDDPSFVPPFFQRVQPNEGDSSFYLYGVALQPDGKILIVGTFTHAGGLPYSGVVRLLSDGSIDTSFRPAAVEMRYPYGGVEPGDVRRVVVDAEGRIWIGGVFSAVNGLPRAGLARLNRDGAVDESVEGGTFALRGYCCGGIRSMTVFAPLPNGDLLIGDRTLTRLRVHAGRTVVEFPQRIATVNYYERAALATVERVGDLIEATTLNFATRDDTARAGAEYVSAAGSITFAAGESAKQIQVALTARSSDSIGKSFLIDLSQTSGAATLGLRQLRIQIEAYDRAGVVDASFRPLPPGDLSRGFRPEVFSIVPQKDGKVLAVGPLLPEWWPERTAGRFNHDGTLDRGFSAPKGIALMTLLPTGKIICAGNGFVARLNEDGSLDPTFKAVPLASGALDILMDPAGRIIVGVGGTLVPVARPFHLLRLSPDGELDTTFTPPTFGGQSYQTALAPDGRLIVAGPTWGAPSRVTRLNHDGTVDDSFVSGGPSGAPGEGALYALAIQNDGKILVTGRFDSFSGNVWGGIIRLNADGTVDRGFQVAGGARTTGTMFGAIGDVTNVALQPGGGIIIAGFFSHFDGVPRAGLARLHPDGALDREFEFRGASQTYEINSVGPAGFESLAVEANGDILVGGLFDEIGGTKVYGFARLNGGLAGVITDWNFSRKALTLATRPGRSHVLDASPDLKTWSPIVTNTAAAVTLEFEDADAPNHPRRFYRARHLHP